MKYALCFLVLIVGCNKPATESKSSPPAPAEDAPASSPETAAAPVAEDTETPPAGAKDIGMDPVDATYEALNIAVNEFFTANGRAPRDIAELVKTQLIPKAPVAPRGKKFVIDPIKRQVALVKS